MRSSKVFAREQRWLSWWHFWSTLFVFFGLIALACPASFSLLIRIPASLLAGCVLVRCFILYHDFQHGTILKGSRVAGAVMAVYGLFTLNPPSIWKRSHNHHHKNNAKIFGASIGSFPVMTASAYSRATAKQKFLYGLSRHPLTIAAGYVTVFLYGMCVRSLVADFRQHLDSAFAIVAHLSLVVVLAIFAPDKLVLAVLIPSTIAAAAGAYLFYAQHNYPEVKLHDRAAWDYVAAALESSSYLSMSPLMAWFTGNIGYHHVHHLNAHIPFYRLPEAMKALPELQSPSGTTLGLRDIRRCLQLKLWDSSIGRLVTYRDRTR